MTTHPTEEAPMADATPIRPNGTREFCGSPNEPTVECLACPCDYHALLALDERLGLA